MKNLHIIYSVPDYVELSDLDFIGSNGCIRYPASGGNGVFVAIGCSNMFFEETFLSQDAMVSIQYCTAKVSSNEI